MKNIFLRMKKMKPTIFPLLLVVTMLALATGCGPSAKLTVPQRQKIVVDMETQTLQRLYQEQPATRDKIRKAAGYGVFSNANVNLILVSAGGGYGVVTDNSTGRRTYMKMALGGLGLGLGAKDYRQVLIFKSREALDKFITSGWEFGGHADAAAKAGETGGELSAEGDIAADIEAYAMTESGLALQATVTGTKYWKNDDLN
jgi:lipid-binding SYLF domain-containing protein